MRLLRLLAVLSLCAAPAMAADLSKIDRTIAKEPKYQSKPKYCLLVFGPEAKTRVWFVLDGDVLYVDRNGNGDLTEAGKRFCCKRKATYSEITKFVADGSTYAISVGDFLIVESTGKPTQSAALAFEPRGKEAPIFHFGGPLAMVLCDGELRRGDKPQQLTAIIGTEGLGEAFVYVLYNEIPPNLHPVAEIEFPNKKPGGSSIKQTIVLSDRC